MECPLTKGKTLSYEREDCLICLNCPYPRCIYDYERKRKKPEFLARIKRNELIVKMSEQGVLSPQLAERFGLNTRHIRRILNGK